MAGMEENPYESPGSAGPGNDKKSSAAPVIAIVAVIAVVLLGVPCLLTTLLLFSWLAWESQKGTGPQPTMRPPSMTTPDEKSHEGP